MEIYRLFAAIRPPDDIVEDLLRLQIGLRDARWSGAEKFHITLGYFGDVTAEQAEILDGRLAEIAQSPFELSLSGVGHFGRSEPHAIWAGVSEHISECVSKTESESLTETGELTRLHKSIRRAARDCKIEMERRDYRPHVTLAYLRGSPDVEAVARWEQAHNCFETNPFIVDSFHLYSSWRRPSGPNIYKVEASYPLLG